MGGPDNSDRSRISKFRNENAIAAIPESTPSKESALDGGLPAIKITTADCKSAIAEWCKAHAEHVSRQFVDPLTSDEQALAEKASNWARIEKSRTKDGIQREFDCRPFDDQLRAIVLTNHDDTKIISLVIQGE